MNEFFRTRMGTEFFSRNVPRLIKAIEGVSDGLSALSKKGEAPKPEKQELSVPLCMGITMRAQAKGDDYPGYFIDILIDGEEYPLASVELEPEYFEGEGRKFSVAVWDSTKSEEPAAIIKSKYTVPSSVFVE